MIASKTLSPTDAGLLRDAMRRSAGAVSVVTAGRGPDRTGMTVPSTIFPSMAPPTMLVAIDRGTSASPVLGAAGLVAVNLPSARQVAVTERFAGRGGLKGAARYAAGASARAEAARTA